MQLDLDLISTDHYHAVSRYIYLTKIVMPELAKTSKSHWPVHNDHCFQRIILDAICEGVWYEKIARPAYRNMSEAQAKQAVQLCDQVINGDIDIDILNHQSLAWRLARNISSGK